MLRSYCSTQLRIGWIDHDAREDLLVHDLGVSGRYKLRKRLADHVIQAILDRVREPGRVLPFSGPSCRARHLQGKGVAIVSGKSTAEYEEPTAGNADGKVAKNLLMWFWGREPYPTQAYGPGFQREA